MVDVQSTLFPVLNASERTPAFDTFSASAEQSIYDAIDAQMHQWESGLSVLFEAVVGYR